MAQKNITARIQQKYDTAANWARNNLVLLSGELGIESDTGLIKIGNGSSAWNSLTYINDFGQANSAGLTAVSDSTSEADLQSAGVPMYISTDDDDDE